MIIQILRALRHGSALCGSPRRPRPVFLLLCLLLLCPTDGRSALIDIGSRTQLFLDDLLIATMKDTRLVLNLPEKAPNNPVIRRDRPWEGNYLHYGTVFYDPQQKQFRMWYTSSSFSPVPGGEPRSTQSVVCYATSRNGYDWEKPSLGLVDFQGSRQNNILDAKSWPGFKGGIILDPRETDPSRRYKGLVQTGTTKDPGMRFDLLFSADGFKWTPYPENPVIDWGEKTGRWGPTSLMGWDPMRQVYAAHMEICAHQRCPLGKRIIGRAESPDMIHWSEAEPIIVPDSEDYPDTEFYSNYVAPYEGWYIGMLWNFRTTNTTILPQFVFSRDGIHYDRRYRQPYIPPGPAGSFDSVAIYGLQPIVHGDKIFIYYGGVNWRSPEQLEAIGADRAHGAIGLAVVPLAGFVSLDGARLQYSEVTTRSFVFSGRKLQVNMRAAFQRWGANPAEVRVEVLGTDHRPIPGFTFAEADPLTQTGTANTASWGGESNVSSLAGRPVKVRFHFKNAKLYSFRFVE
jgi:hypothetical protein